ncbi:MAG: hypothetical protein V4773_31220, partial [Verrucomicrobiota bacterium]
IEPGQVRLAVADLMRMARDGGEAPEQATEPRVAAHEHVATPRATRLKVGTNGRHANGTNGLHSSHATNGNGAHNGEAAHKGSNGTNGSNGHAELSFSRSSNEDQSFEDHR